MFLNQFVFSQNYLGPESSSFNPLKGKYIVSGWVKEELSSQVVTYTNSEIKINILSLGIELPEDYYDAPAPSTFSFKPSGAIIDGWQRIVGIVEIPEIAPDQINSQIQIELLCSSTTADCYFDDIRFYPYNGNLKSFVYDEDTQRLMAELDENNYATFYEYDLEGGLVRVKKETERGVYTIQETRSNNQKQ